MRPRKRRANFRWRVPGRTAGLRPRTSPSTCSDRCAKTMHPTETATNNRLPQAPTFCPPPPVFSSGSPPSTTNAGPRGARRSVRPIREHDRRDGLDRHDGPATHTGRVPRTNSTANISGVVFPRFRNRPDRRCGCSSADEIRPRGPPSNMAQLRRRTARSRHTVGAGPANSGRCSAGGSRGRTAISAIRCARPHIECTVMLGRPDVGEA